MSTVYSVFINCDGVQMFFQDTKLNVEQNLAVKTVVKAVDQSVYNNRIVLLQGPPGTGKSHVIVATIMKIYAVMAMKKTKAK